MNYAIILAGGVGKRFWPLSQTERPKQFLKLFSNNTLLEETILRLAPLIDKENIYIATHIIYKEIIQNYMKKLKLRKENIFFEPMRKNTFLPIAYISYKIFQNDAQGVVIVLPSDHLIKCKREFLLAIKKAIYMAKKGFIVTLGVKPDYPETEYGYIRIFNRPLARDRETFKVEKFIEKPSLSKAKIFLKDKRYFWNAGIFIFRVDLMMEEIKRYQPKVFSLIKENLSNLNKIWKNGLSSSIDYAIMEHSKKLALVPFKGEWSDLGRWQAIADLLKKDKNKNIFKCKRGYIDSENKNIFVWSENRFAACLGLKDLYIIETEHGLLICSKDKINRIKELIKSKN